MEMSTSYEYRLCEQQELRHVRPEEEGIAVNVSAIHSASRTSVEKIDMTESSIYSTFKSNYDCWSAFNAFSSANKMKNIYFDSIVKMGKDAVPLIYNELKKGPTDLVYALEAIFNYPFGKGNFVPLKQSCDLWISILERTGLFS